MDRRRRARRSTSIEQNEQSFHPPVTVFTTRPDTIFGATFVALAPEHALVREIVAAGGPQAAAVRAYAEAAARRLELERQQGVPSGVFTGL